ncbi:hypothetical protein PHLGIDRAFT_129727, partial [Phlebiopsis gigantea 11061_1 CR5-6]
MSEPTAASLALAPDERSTNAEIAARELLDQGILDESIRLRRHKNDALPSISRLPPEIIAEILVLFVHHARQSCSCLHWIRVAHVCSRWRSIARGLSSLWAVIYTIPDPRCTDMFLALSQTSPLSIISALPEYREIVDAKFFVPLAHAMDRIQHMDLSLRWPTMVGLRRFSQDVSVVPKAALSLETLDLTYIRSQTYSKYGVDLMFDDPGPTQNFWFFSSATPMPTLRTLRLTGFPLSYTKNLSRPTLTELRVRATGPFDLSIWQSVLAALPSLEVLHITGEGEDDIPMAPSASPSGPNIELRQLRELCLSRRHLISDKTSVCTRLLHQLRIPSSCKIEVSIAKDDPLYTIDTVMSKKDGRAYLGEPQALTSLRLDPLRMCLWLEAGPHCHSRDETCDVKFYTSGAELLCVMPRAPTFFLNNIKLLCICENHLEMQLLTLFTQLCELHVHGIWRARKRLKGLALLPPTALRQLRSLTLEWSRWRARGGSEPLSLIIDAVLTARREAGAAIEELHLHQLYSLDDQEDVSWLERMEASEMPT